MRHTFSVTVIAAALAALASPAFAIPALTVADTSFSAGPGTDYGPAPTIKLGTHVDVIWCGTHKNWCLIDIHNKRGWVPMADLTFKLPKVVTLNDDGTPNSNSGDGNPPGGPNNSDPNKSKMMTEPQGHNNPPPMTNVNKITIVKSP